MRWPRQQSDGEISDKALILFGFEPLRCAVGERMGGETPWQQRLRNGQRLRSKSFFDSAECKKQLLLTPETT